MESKTSATDKELLDWAAGYIADLRTELAQCRQRAQQDVLRQRALRYQAENQLEAERKAIADALSSSELLTNLIDYIISRIWERLPQVIANSDTGVKLEKMQALLPNPRWFELWLPLLIAAELSNMSPSTLRQLCHGSIESKHDEAGRLLIGIPSLLRYRLTKPSKK